MRLRYPAVPLVTHSPYFSLWSPDDVPNRESVCHWTGSPHPLAGVLRIGKRAYGFLGRTGCPPMKTVSLEVSACSTEYRMECPEAFLTCRFTSPLLLDDLPLMARPVTYLSLTVTPKGENLPEAFALLSAGSALCLDHPGQSPTVFHAFSGRGWSAGSLSNAEQKPLNRAGDDVRIDWGSFCLAARCGKLSCREGEQGLEMLLEAPLEAGKEALLAVCYDEVLCIRYFGEDLEPLWKEECSDLPALLDRAFSEYTGIDRRCRDFSASLHRGAVEAGGEKYAQLLDASYRQVIAAHGICRDREGRLLFISKECFSNGCAATADVSCPSIPLFLLYRPELVFAMMRPIMKYAASPAWPFDFAPHDAGTYPLLEGQVYSGGTDPAYQMPVEECGNLLLMTAAATLASGDDSFAAEHWELLSTWASYLKDKGLDPENQLCTDDFAGHLAHNCNLSLKAISGVGAFGLLLKRRGETDRGEAWLESAREMAGIWMREASNGDGTYRLAFDRPGSFSLKYNAVWDRILGLGLFPDGTWDRELASYLARQNRYGTPLDDRAGYTKSDWLVWVASLMDSREAFEAMTAALWAAYDAMPQRVPLCDWYETEDAWQTGFQNRTVQGGLFMKLLTDRAPWAKSSASPVEKGVSP